MKVAVTSDLHGYLPDIQSCDVLLICGDIVPLYYQTDYIRSQVWFKSEFARWVKDLPCEDVVIIGGNHDGFLSVVGEDEIEFSLQRPTDYKVEYLNNSYCTLVDSGLTIYGTPNCPVFGSWYFMNSEEELKDIYSKIPKGVDVLISHTPPRIGNFDVILEGDKKKCGSKALAKAIKEKAPKYAFFGHIHSGDHNLSIPKGYTTKMANVSLLNESYKPIYPVLYLDI